MSTVGEGERGTNGKSKNLLFDTVHCDNLEGWEREARSREVPEGGDICIPMADPC